MRTRLRHLWETLTTGYWFVPAIMSIGAILLAWLLLELDRRSGVTEQIGWLYSGGSDGASVLLSTVAGSVITVAGVAFSVTVAALSQASNQFGPRLLRNFMRDTGNQVVLGTFVSTFLYCLLVLRTVHGGSDGPAPRREFVPQASVTAAVVMAAASIAVLIYFIHHVARSLQAPSVVAGVAADLERVVARLSTEQVGAAVALDQSSGECGFAAQQAAGQSNRPVRASAGGYIQAVDYRELIVLASKARVVLRAPKNTHKTQVA